MSEDRIIVVKLFEAASGAEVDELAEAGSMPEIYTNLGVGKPWDSTRLSKLREQSIMDASASIENREYYHWIIQLVPQNISIGYIGLRPSDYKGLEGLQLRYFVHPEYQGKGIATRALEEVVNLFQYRKIWSFIVPKNISSKRVVEKMGFKKIQQVKLHKLILDAYLLN